MESLSKSDVVHFVSETRILYHVSETNVNAKIKSRAVLATAAGARDESWHVGLGRAPGLARRLARDV